MWRFDIRHIVFASHDAKYVNFVKMNTKFGTEVYWVQNNGYKTNYIVIGTITLMSWSLYGYYGLIIGKWESLKLHAIISQKQGYIHIIFHTSKNHSSLSCHILSLTFKCPLLDTEQC